MKRENKNEVHYSQSWHNWVNSVEFCEVYNL